MSKSGACIPTWCPNWGFRSGNTALRGPTLIEFRSLGAKGAATLTLCWTLFLTRIEGECPFIVFTAKRSSELDSISQTLCDLRCPSAAPYGPGGPPCHSSQRPSISGARDFRNDADWCLQSVHNPMADSGLLHQLFNKLFWNIDYHRQFPITPCPSKAHCVF